MSCLFHLGVSIQSTSSHPYFWAQVRVFCRLCICTICWGTIWLLQICYQNHLHFDYELWLWYNRADLVLFPFSILLSSALFLFRQVSLFVHYVPIKQKAHTIHLYCLLCVSLCLRFPFSFVGVASSASNRILHSPVSEDFSLPHFICLLLDSSFTCSLFYMVHSLSLCFSNPTPVVFSLVSRKITFPTTIIHNIWIQFALIQIMPIMKWYIGYKNETIIFSALFVTHSHSPRKRETLNAVSPKLWSRERAGNGRCTTIWGKGGHKVMGWCVCVCTI